MQTRSSHRVLRYIFLPQIFPRIQQVFRKIFLFNYLIAMILQAGGLIPRSSRIFDPRYTHNMRMRDVIFAASKRVKFCWADADKLAFLAAVILSVFLIALQIAFILLVCLVPSAEAASFFETDPSRQTTDVVLIFLEQVFGPNIGIFNSGASVVGTPIHNALYAMLSFYSQAMMVLAVFIVVYYIITVVGEAAISGTPFGRRFNSLWAPVRLCVALGLLVPLSSGLNSAQYITLYVAKMGSGLASQGWMRFAQVANQPGEVFAKALPSKTEDLVKGVFLSEVCRIATNRATEVDAVQHVTIVGNVIRPGFSDGAQVLADAGATTPGADPNRFRTTPLLANQATLRWSRNPGDLNPDPTCGEVSFPLMRSTFTVHADTRVPLASVRIIQEAYIDDIRQIQIQVAGAARMAVDLWFNFNNPSAGGARPDTRDDMVRTLRHAVDSSQRRVNNAVSNAVIQLAQTDGGQIYQDMIARGWGGAGLFYVRIGEINQKTSAAARLAPSSTASSGQPSWFEAALNWVSSWWGGADNSRTFDMRNLIDNSETLFTTRVRVSPELVADGSIFDIDSLTRSIDTLVKSIFGLHALYDFRAEGAANLNPMVGIQAIGNDMIERAKIFAIAWGGTAFVGRIADMLPGRAAAAVSGVMSMLAPIFSLFALIGLGLGILLFYLLPLMPFIYFFFAVVAWVMEIFEAVVAMPLWALAHLKIDGDGLPGPLATNGYFLLLGVLLRPILIVFGMIGGYVIFGGGAYFLQSTFTVVVDNVRGDGVGAFGAFVYTVIFAFLCYHLGLICFKMVDTLPQGILRWIGQGGATPFSDNRPDPLPNAQTLMFAASGIMSQARGAMGESGKAWEKYQEKAAAGRGAAQGGRGGGSDVKVTEPRR